MKVVPREFARSGRSWSGSIPLAQFERLAADVIASRDTQVAVELSFASDENDIPHMQGCARIRVHLPCHRCLAEIETEIKADIDARIVPDEQEARLVVHQFDVIVCENGPVKIADLIEDDLMLNIPWRVCPDDTNCVHRQSRYLADPPGADDERRSKPFAGLKSLIKNEAK